MRVLFKDNLGEVEITSTTERLDGTAFSMEFVVGNFIYIASDLPYNHTYFSLLTKNTADAKMKIEYWAGNNKWIEVVELRDDTRGLKESGYIEFTPNKDHGWVCDDSSKVGLTKVVYDKYWTRISFDVDLTEVTLNYMGHKFSDDSDLFSLYPIFNNDDLLTAFEVGKETWEAQAVEAAKDIILDLKKKGVILKPEQILERRNFIKASVAKTAEIIFNAFGKDYSEQKKDAEADYSKKIDLKQYDVDTNSDAILQPQETKMKSGWLSR